MDHKGNTEPGGSIALRSDGVLDCVVMSLPALPIGSHPTPVLGYLLFYITDPIYKARYFEKGFGYDPVGTEPKL